MTNPKLVQYIETWELRGNGTEKNPYRRIRTIWTTDGEWVAEGRDPGAGQTMVEAVTANTMQFATTPLIPDAELRGRNKGEVPPPAPDKESA